MWIFKVARDFLVTYLPKQRGASPHTVKGYRESVNMLLTFAASSQGKPLREVTVDDLGGGRMSAFADWLADERGCKARTINNRLAGVRTFLRYCGWRDPSCNAVYLEALEVPNREAGKRLDVDHFGEEALDAMLAQPDATKRLGCRDLFLMVILYDTGCRISEVLGMLPSDFRSTPGGLAVEVRGKGGKVRVVPVTAEAAGHLESYLGRLHADVPEGTPLFYTKSHGELHAMSVDNAERIVRKHSKAARETCPSVPERVVPHMFRHSRAMHLYRKGVPLALIGEWLGHENLETTLIYAYADTEMKRDVIGAATSSLVPVPEDGQESSTEITDDEIRRLYGLV